MFNGVSAIDLLDVAGNGATVILMLFFWRIDRRLLKLEFEYVSNKSEIMDVKTKVEALVPN